MEMIEFSLKFKDGIEVSPEMTVWLKECEEAVRKEILSLDPYPGEFFEDIGSYENDIIWHETLAGAVKAMK